MTWRKMFKPVDRSRFRPVPGEDRVHFLRRLAEAGFPFLGYCEPMRSPVWELCREVVALRAEVEALRQDLLNAHDARGHTAAP